MDLNRVDCIWGYGMIIYDFRVNFVKFYEPLEFEIFIKRNFRKTYLRRAGL